MARTYAMGAELGTTAEWLVVAGVPALSTVTVKTGNWSIQCNGTAVAFGDNLPTVFTDTHTWKAEVYTAAVPSARNVIAQMTDNTNGTWTVSHNNNGTLGIKLGGSADTPVEVFSGVTLPLSQWNTLEVRYNKLTTKPGATGAGQAILRLNGTDIATAGGLSGFVAKQGVGVGNGPRNVAQNIFYDDVVYDNTETFIGTTRVIMRAAQRTNLPTYDAFAKTGTTPYFANVPFEAANYATATAASQKQTTRLGAFDVTQTGRGTQVIGASDTIYQLRPMLSWLKSSAQTTNVYSYMYRHAGVDTIGANQTLTATNALFHGIPPITTNLTLANANILEVGGSEGAGAGTNFLRLTDIYAYAEYLPAVASSAKKGSFFALFN